MNSPFEPLVDLLEGLIHNSGDEMMMRMVGGREDLILQMPQFLIDHLPEALASRYGFMGYSQSNGMVKMFEGVQIQPSPDLALTLFHKNYPLYKNDWMIVKISLDPALQMKKSWCDSYVISLQKTSYFKTGVNPTNN